jgi:hypothetical protein
MIKKLIMIASLLGSSDSPENLDLSKTAANPQKIKFRANTTAVMTVYNINPETLLKYKDPK